MPHTLDELERQRAGILQQIAELGDLRRGSITAITARCGKPNCHCHLPHHPGHGPNFRLTRKVRGKTVSETFPNPAALRKAQREVTEFHKFQQLAQAFVEVNEKLCRLRPVAEAAEGDRRGEEKKRPQPSSGKWRKK